MTSAVVEPLLSVRGMTKRFGSFVALSDASLTLDAGEIRALCGGNGAGKSTLVKILTGVLHPNEGTIAIGGRVVAIRNPVEAQRHGLALVAQELSLAPDLSVYDNLWLGHAEAPFLRRSAAARRRASRALAEVGLDGLDLDRPARGLTLGQRQLVEIARGIVRDARILILDEPTATLSNAEIDKVFKAMNLLKSQGRSIIFITHRLGEVFEFCDSLTMMRNGEIIVSAGVGDVSRAQLIEWMLGRHLEEIYPAHSSNFGEIVLDLVDLNIPGMVSDLSFQCRAGEILGIVGQIGSGAIEAVRAIAGLDHQASGRLRVRGRPAPLGSVVRAAAVGIQFVSEDRAHEGVFLHLDGADNLTATRIPDHARMGMISRGTLRSLATKLAASVGFDAGRLVSRVDELSGGNQQKLAVGRCTGRAAGGVLLLNEPTRGVDMGARAEIYQSLRRFCDVGYAIILASTDMEETLGLADRIVTMYRGRTVREHRRDTFDEAAILADITHPAEAA